ncbi:MAG: TIGR00266 family protein [Thermococcus sp.]|uniref:TIGR00266 family protein n=1 Tax=Thermococcus sp. TaxID=35749 RepID=UPI000F2C08C4|nr:TIGR00266 family protein [Thermococcus sp.]RLF76959.1 MAG: TIGR00266 family protein [Thermococci archaeon]MCD6139405.1 TIGR00266 family protein [Thermococcus sp.]MCD6143581.1 TIGR00266 family protein [Thermococcus sp.]RLF79991.1 MAG: TIGR00266 family protein [Thermococci archaeon]RLF85107.1 MAG: TIGR00266 family protein [Thermococci archaeon]
MRYEIIQRPSFSLVEVELEEGEAIKAEPGAMVHMSPTIKIETKTGGIFKALKRSMLGGESIFINTFRAEEGKGNIGLAPAYMGDIEPLEIRGTLYTQSGAFLASSETIEIDTKFGGAKTFFSREGLFLLKLSGDGTVFLSSFGGIYKKELRNERFIIDTGHLVAFTEGLDFRVKRVGGLKSTIFGGEGLVAEFYGSGTLYIQTRSIDSFLDWLIPFLPKSRD